MEKWGNEDEAPPVSVQVCNHYQTRAFGMKTRLRTEKCACWSCSSVFFFLFRRKCSSRLLFDGTSCCLIIASGTCCPSGFFFFPFWSHSYRTAFVTRRRGGQEVREFVSKWVSQSIITVQKKKVDHCLLVGADVYFPEKPIPSQCLHQTRASF